MNLVERERHLEEAATLRTFELCIISDKRVIADEIMPILCQGVTRRGYAAQAARIARKAIKFHTNSNRPDDARECEKILSFFCPTGGEQCGI